MAKRGTGAEALVTPITTSGATVPATASEVTVVAALAAGGSVAPDTAVKASGAQSFKMTPAVGGTLYLKGTDGLTTPAVNFAADACFRFTATAPPTGKTFPLIQLRNGASNLFTVSWIATGFLRVTGSVVNTTTVAFQPTSFLRVGIATRINTATPGSTQYRAAVFANNSSTPIAGLDTGWLTGAPAVSGLGIDTVNFGLTNTDSDGSVFWLDSLRWDPTATDLIPADAILPTVSVVLTPSDGTLPYTMTAKVVGTGGTGVNRTYEILDWGDAAVNGGTGSASAEQASDTFTKTVTGSADFGDNRATPARVIVAKVYEDAA